MFRRWKLVFSAANLDTQVFLGHLIPRISQDLIKAPLACVTEFLTHRMGRCLQILQQRLGKGMIKTQELGSS